MGVMACLWVCVLVLIVSFVICDNTCNVNGSRQDCGYAGITLSECEEAGCCWYPVYNNPDNLPWCFYPNYQSTPPSSSQCMMNQKRKAEHGDMLGNFYLGVDAGTLFVTWAPHAAQVWVDGVFSGSNQTYPMTFCEDDNHWVAQIANAAPGDQYSYIVSYVGQNITHIDPYCREVVSNQQGEYIGSVIHDPNFDWGSASDFV